MDEGGETEQNRPSRAVAPSLALVLLLTLGWLAGCRDSAPQPAATPPAPAASSAPPSQDPPLAVVPPPEISPPEIREPTTVPAPIGPAPIRPAPIGPAPIRPAPVGPGREPQREGEPPPRAVQPAKSDRALTATFPRLPPAPGGATRADRWVVVKSVADGDTISLVGGEKVRYLGVDTPERGQKLYATAAQHNRDLVQGKRVLLERDQSETDRYGRLLRYVWVEGEGGELVHVGEGLVRAGLAKATPYPPDTARSSDLAVVEAEARKLGAGLWRSFEQETHYIGSSNKFHRPDCRNAKSIRRPKRFESREAATRSGRRPARCCNP